MKTETATTRTVKRNSLELNRGKFAKLENFAKAYRDEKRVHLEWYQHDGRFALAHNSRPYRDGLTANDYAKDRLLSAQGRTAIGGNIRIILLPDEKKVEVHVTFRIENVPPARGETAAIDVGLTEVAVDDLGNVYGERLGGIVAKHADQNKEKNQKRNKLHALEKQHKKAGNKKKARNLRRFNLGRKKLKARKRRARIEQTNEINRAIAEFLKKRQPARFAAEKLDIRRKAKSRQMSRRTAMWMRSILAERIEFKASAARLPSRAREPGLRLSEAKRSHTPRKLVQVAVTLTEPTAKQTSFSA